jgi:hypothetical protein
MATLRQTAIKTRASDIVNGKFIRKEGLEPSYVLTNLGQRISRIDLVGVIIDKFMSEEGNYSSITIDDDSESIRVKAFKENVNIFNKLELGNLVLVIGKVREYSNEIYIIPDMVKKITNSNYEILHRIEVLKQILEQKKMIEEIKKIKDKFSDLEEMKKHVEKEMGIDSDIIEGAIEIMDTGKSDNENYKLLVMKVMDKLDTGDGVEFKKLLEGTKLKENVFEGVINELLSDGTLYEPKPGILKRV